MRRFIYKYGYKLAKLYWFFRRPTTQGVRSIVLCDREVLLVRHSYGSDLWTTVGGGVKKGEALETALRREVKEEVGLELDTVKKVGEIFNGAEYKEDTIHVYVSTVTNKQIRIDGSEIIVAEWFLIDALPETISPLAKEYFTLAKLY